MNKRQPIVVIFISCLLVGAGFLLSIVQGIQHAPEYISAYFTKVEHPIKPSYTNYDRLLHAIIKRNRVDYVAARNSPDMAKALHEFASMSCDEFASDSDKLVYWINAYNLFVIKTIADRYPVSALQSVTNDLNSRQFTAGGQSIAVKDIRELKIQPQLSGTMNSDYTDCRMLMLICGGSMGYPVVCDHALTSETIPKDMDDNTKKFMLVPYNCYFSKETRVLYISPLFQWNEPIFEQSFSDPFDFVLFCMPPENRPDPHDIHTKKSYNKKFDWRINDISTKD